MSQPYKSGRQQNLNLGITSVTENRTVLQTIGKVGIGTTNAQNHSLFVVGTTNITGDINVGGASTFVGVGTFRDSLYVANQLYVGGVNVSGGASIGQDITTRNFLASGISTFNGLLDANAGANITGGTTLDNLNVTGIATIASLDVLTNFDVYDTQAVFHNNVRIDGNLSIGGTATAIFAQDLRVFDKEITLGITTDAFGNDISNDTTANHGGISIASTVGSPLVDLTLAGFSTLPKTYKQLMWVGANSYGFGTTDAWMFNYAVGIGSTLVPNGVYLAAGAIQATKDTLTAPNINSTSLNVTGSSTLGVTTTSQFAVSGVSTFAGLVDANGGATIDNVRIGIAGDNEIDTSTGNLTLDSFAGTVTVDDQLIVTGISTFNNNVDIDKDLNVDRNLTVAGISTFSSTNASELFVSGVTTTSGLVVTSTSVFQDTINANGGVVGNLAGNVTSSGNNTFGSIFVSGISTFAGITTVTGNTLFAKQLNVSGVSTLAILHTPRLTYNGTDFGGGGYIAKADGAGGWSWENVPGIFSVNNILNGFNVSDEGLIVGTAGSITQLDFKGNNIIASADAQPNGIATIRLSDTPSFLNLTVTPGISTLGVTTSTSLFSNDLSVSGLSTFIGVGTFRNDLYVGGNLYIQNDLVFDEFTARNINVTGVSTLGIASASQLWISGVTTTASLTVTGTSLFQGGVQANSVIFANGGVTGNLTGNVTSTGSNSFGQVNVTGVVTARQFIGDIQAGVATITTGLITNASGTTLNYTGLSTITNISSANINVSGVATAALLNVGVGGTIITTTNTPRVGINSVSPGYTLDVNGDINFNGLLYQNNSPFIASRWSAGSGDDIYRLNGDVGIGTTNPNYTLEVVGNARISGVTSVSTLQLYGTVSAGNTVGANGQYLKSTGVGVTWADFPTLRTTGISTATEGQSSFAFTYNVGFIDVFVNGVKLTGSEYSAINGSSVVLNSPAFENDIVEFIGYNTISTSGSGGGGGASAINDLTDVTITTPLSGEVLSYDGAQWVNDYTVVTTTSTTSQTAIHTLPISTYRSVEYLIQATQGTNYHLTKVLSVHDGTLAYPTEYGILYTNTSLASFTVDVSGGNMRLLATPSSSSLTTYKIKFTAIKV